MPSLKQLHLLVTYRCTLQCDHCFVWGSPEQSAVMTIEQVRRIFEQGDALGSIDSVSFEGGEPFLFYGLLLEGVREAKKRGWRADAVTNVYWATSTEDALLWLKPLVDAGLDSLVMSEDAYHGSGDEDLARNARSASDQLGIGEATIAIREAPASVGVASPAKGEAITGGAVRFRGRAAAHLTPELPRKPAQELVACPHEELANPIRVHIDPLGYVHLCQGLAMGNLFQTPLLEMVSGYEPDRHPVCGPLLSGGPAALANAYDLPHDATYVEECHMCYELRESLRERFPEYIGPAQMYGVVRHWA